MKKSGRTMIKRYAGVVAFGFLSATSLWAQNSYDTMKNLASSRDYDNAAKYASTVIRENAKNHDALVLAGDVFAEVDKLDSAIIAYRKAKEVKDNAVVSRKLSYALAQTGNAAEAVTIMRDAVKRDAKDVNNQLALADALVIVNPDDTKEAELIITKVKNANPKLAEPYVALGNVYYAQKVYELAQMNYEQALSVDPTLLDARMKLANAYYRMANAETDRQLGNQYFTRSLEEWNAVTRQDPMNSRAFFEQGKILYLAGQHLDAARTFYEFLRLRPEGDNKLGRWYLAQSLHTLGACDSAAPQLVIVARELDSVSVKAQSMLAECYFNQRNFTAAAREYKALKDKNMLPLSEMERYGAAVFNTGDTLGSIPIYRELLNADPSQCKLMLQFGYLLRGRKMYSEAIDVFKKRIASCPDSLNGRLYYLIGASYFSDNKVPEAIAALQQGIATEPASLPFYTLLGEIYLDAKNNTEAEKQFLKTIELGKGNPANTNDVDNSYRQLAVMHYGAKNYKKVGEYAKQWIEFNPENANGYFFAGLAADLTKDYKTATKYYNETLKRDPSNKTASDRISAIKNASVGAGNGKN
ncbi:MAG TPA: tetratricopeptide repeat protein [Patescibacteria group bacterium]|nr:tetratricopeptide repeat protein [Patescibacteria group bacterium]